MWWNLWELNSSMTSAHHEVITLKDVLSVLNSNMYKAAWTWMLTAIILGNDFERWVLAPYLFWDITNKGVMLHQEPHFLKELLTYASMTHTLNLNICALPVNTHCSAWLYGVWGMLPWSINSCSNYDLITFITVQHSKRSSQSWQQNGFLQVQFVLWV